MGWSTHNFSIISDLIARVIVPSPKKMELHAYGTYKFWVNFDTLLLIKSVLHVMFTDIVKIRPNSYTSNLIREKFLKNVYPYSSE